MTPIWVYVWPQTVGVHGYRSRGRHLLVVMLNTIHFGWTRDDGYFFTVPIDLNHPVVQSAICIPHDIIQDNQFLELFAERLLQTLGPVKMRSCCLILRRRYQHMSIL